MAFMASFSTAPRASGNELSRLLTAAVVNRRFCNLLLTNPASALEKGYNGESFSLARDERELILSIEAQSLADFASQLTVARPNSGHASPSPESRRRPS